MTNSNMWCDSDIASSPFLGRNSEIFPHPKRLVTSWLCALFSSKYNEWKKIARSVMSISQVHGLEYFCSYALFTESLLWLRVYGIIVLLDRMFDIKWFLSSVRCLCWTPLRKKVIFQIKCEKRPKIWHNEQEIQKKDKTEKIQACKLETIGRLHDHNA